MREVMPRPVRPTQKQRILEVLSDGRWHTAAELYRTGCVLHSRISDLRNKDGYTIERRNIGGTGAEAHEYRLVSATLDEALNDGEGSAAPPVVSVSSSGADIPAADGITADPHGTAPYVQLELGAAA